MNRYCESIELLGCVDRGAFAEVWHGTTASGESVAVKVFCEEDLEYAAQQAEEHCLALARVQDEAIVVPRGVATVRHPRDGTRAALVMGLIPGEPLSRSLPVDRGVAGRMLRQIGSALARLHREGLVHGDLKRENVLITPTGPVLIDLFYASALVPRNVLAFSSDIRQFEELARQVLDQVPAMCMTEAEGEIERMLSDVGLVRGAEAEPTGCYSRRSTLARERDHVDLALVNGSPKPGNNALQLTWASLTLSPRS